MCATFWGLMQGISYGGVWSHLNLLDAEQRQLSCEKFNYVRREDDHECVGVIQHLVHLHHHIGLNEGNAGRILDWVTLANYIETSKIKDHLM